MPSKLSVNPLPGNPSSRLLLKLTLLCALSGTFFFPRPFTLGVGKVAPSTPPDDVLCEGREDDSRSYDELLNAPLNDVEADPEVVVQKLDCGFFFTC